jgi:hypothetical protein
MDKFKSFTEFNSADKLDENVIIDKLKDWFKKGTSLAKDVWEATKRESRETKEAVRLLDLLIKGQEVTKEQREFLKTQAVDLVKVLPLIAIQGIPVPVPITPFLIVLGKKVGFDILPNSHTKTTYKV